MKGQNSAHHPKMPVRAGSVRSTPSRKTVLMAQEHEPPGIRDSVGEDASETPAQRQAEGGPLTRNY